MPLCPYQPFLRSLKYLWMNLHLRLNSFLLLKGVSALEMSAFEIDITKHFIIKSNTNLLPDKDKLKIFQERHS